MKCGLNLRVDKSNEFITRWILQQKVHSAQRLSSWNPFVTTLWPCGVVLTVQASTRPKQVVVPTGEIKTTQELKHGLHATPSFVQWWYRTGHVGV